MKKHLAALFKFIVSLGIGIALVYWFLSQMSEEDKHQVFEDIKRANYLWLLAPPVIGIFSSFLRTERWRMLLLPLGHKPRFWNTLHSVMIMYFVNLFVPRLGEVTRCGILARYENVPLDKGIGTMVVERILDLLCLAVLALILIVAENDMFATLYTRIASDSQNKFADIIAQYKISPLVQYGVFGVLFATLCVYIGFKFKDKGTKYVLQSVWSKVTGLLQSVIAVKDTGKPFTLFLYTIGIWGCYLAMSYVNFWVFPQTSHLNILAGGVCLFFAGIAYSLTPGGLGLYPLFMKIILLAYGLEGSVVYSLGLLAWTTQTLFVLGQGLISFTYLAIISRQAALQKEPLKA